MNRITGQYLLGARILLAAVAALSVGCAGSASVRYQGSVVASPSPGHSFDADPNPGALPPIAGADVTLCICTQPCVCSKSAQSVKTDGSGLYTIPEKMFAGFIGVDHYITVAAEAEGYEPVSYSFIYEKVEGDRSRHFGQKALNFRLRAVGAAQAPLAAPHEP